METDNSSHYKYMPRLPEEDQEIIENPEPVETVAEVITEETGIASELPEEREEQEDREEKDSAFYRSPLASFIYALFSPLAVPTIICILLFLLSILYVVAPGAVVPYSLTVFGASCVVPLITIYILLKVGEADSFKLFSARERVIPYIIEIMALGGLTLFFVFKGATPWIWTIFLGCTATAVANFLINFRLRVSCHCSAMGALVASLIVISKFGMPQMSMLWWIIGALFFAGYTGTLAISYGKHNIWEVMVGYITGFLSIILFSLIH